MAHFDTKRFLRDNFPDYQSMCSMMQAWGYTPPKMDAARKWWTREGNIPGEWLPLLLATLEAENGGAVAVREWIVQ
jgi:hypothetical protein